MTDPLFFAYLAQFDDDAWLRAVDRLQPAMHAVDRAATRAWFHFFPMRLQRALETAPDPEALADHLRLQGRWRLADQRDTSHWFLFGHRYWADVVAAVGRAAGTAAAPGSLDLAAQVQAIARDVARSRTIPESWAVGITAVGLRTAFQSGLSDRVQSPVPASPLLGGPDAEPDTIVARRRKADSRWFARLRGGPAQLTVTFDERPPARTFPLIATQHLTTAAALDTRDYRTRDARCTEGPIPVHCRSCSCGTCWVGVIDGAERLSAMEPRERTTLAALGYLETAEPRPVVRLACMAQADGPVTLAIPPWNGQIGVRLEKARSGT